MLRWVVWVLLGVIRACFSSLHEQTTYRHTAFLTDSLNRLINTQSPSLTPSADLQTLNIPHWPLQQTYRCSVSITDSLKRLIDTQHPSLTPSLAPSADLQTISLPHWLPQQTYRHSVSLTDSLTRLIDTQPPTPAPCTDSLNRLIDNQTPLLTLRQSVSFIDLYTLSLPHRFIDKELVMSVLIYVMKYFVWTNARTVNLMPGVQYITQVCDACDEKDHWGCMWRTVPAYSVCTWFQRWWCYPGKANSFSCFSMEEVMQI